MAKQIKRRKIKQLEKPVLSWCVSFDEKYDSFGFFNYFVCFMVAYMMGDKLVFSGLMDQFRLFELIGVNEGRGRL